LIDTLGLVVGPNWKLALKKGLGTWKKKGLGVSRLLLLGLLRKRKPKTQLKLKAPGEFPGNKGRIAQIHGCSDARKTLSHPGWVHNRAPKRAPPGI